MNQKERSKKRAKELLIARIELTKKLSETGYDPQLCEICNKQSSEDHHIIKKAEDNYKFNSEVNNLIRLCRKCHMNFHSYKSNELFNTNKGRFLKCMEWLRLNNKHVTLSKFERNLSDG